MNGSLNFRLLASASIVLALFFALAGMALDRAFTGGAKQAIRERLQIQIYSLLSAADLSPSGEITLPDSLPEARFSNPGSGLYGYVFSATGKINWRSKSSFMNDLSPIRDLPAGKSEFISERDDRFILFYSVMWENILGMEKNYIFAASEDSRSFMQQVSAFRKTLWAWFVGIGLTLIIAQLAILRWSLKPLRVIVNDLEDIEAGNKYHLDDDYPRELQGLAINLNALIDSERTHLERYRNTLADLAHSLKTPLAILRGVQQQDALDSDLQATVREQVSRMDNLVQYQLQRAAARGQKRLSLAIDVEEIIIKIIASLDKVHMNKGVICTFRKNKSGLYFCEEGDLYEIAGNLLDNAYKWCSRSVHVAIEFFDEPGKSRNALRIIIKDDGPGIPKEKLLQVLKRGIRADEHTQGHGIGLAVVNEIVRLSGGELKASKSDLGGLRWDVVLPAPI